MSSGCRFFFLIVVLVMFTGCNLFDRDSSGVFNQIEVPKTGNANVKFQVIVPETDKKEIKPSLRLSGNATVDFKLVLVFPGAEGNAQTVILQKSATVSADGSAEVSFAGVPETAVIGQIQINGGNLGGKTSFHGAADLKSGDNVVEVAPVGSGHTTDVAAGVMLEIIRIPEIIKAAPANLVSAIGTSVQTTINLNLSGSELYSDALNRFVTSPQLSSLSLTKLTVGNDGSITAESGSQTLWNKTSSELWQEVTGAGDIKAMRVIRQGFSNTSQPLVAFSDLQNAKFALAYLGPDGKITSYFLADGSSLSHMSAVQAVADDNSVILGAVANGVPVILRWNGKDSVAAGWPVSDSAVLWSSAFAYTTAASAIPYPQIEQLSFEPGVREALKCVVRNPKSLMLQEYSVTLAGVIEALFSPAAEAMFALTALPGNRSITLHWDAIPDAEFYNLYWSLSADVPLTGDGMNVISRVNRPFTHSSLKEGQTYHYVITWTINGQESAPSKVAAATPWYIAVPQFYRVTYYGNGQTGGQVPVDAVSYSPGDKAAILTPDSSLLRRGFEFAGWNTAADGSGTDYAVGQQVELSNADLLLYAKWRPVSYRVTYDGNGNTSGTVPAQASYASGAQVTIAGNTGSLQKTGYVFAGWNTAADGSGTVYQAAAVLTVANADVTLYAVWNSLARVTYHGNNNTSGEVPVDSTVYKAGDTVTLLANSGLLARTGFEFIGWNTAADGSGTFLAAGATTTMPAEGLVFYARWRSTTKYNVTFLGNGSDGGAVPTALSHMEGETVTVPGNTGGLTNAGKTFFGWNTKADGSGLEYTPAETFIMGAADVSLYAQWQEFAGGEGTSASPYLVASPEQLNRVRNHLEAHFQQIADIDLVAYSTGNGWVPIGSTTLAFPSLKFKGNYDGNGHKITNLFIDRQAEESVGLFGYVDNAVIRNLTLENADVTGKNAVGILVGTVNTGTISNCHSSGKVRCISARSGGLIGSGMSIALQDSSSSASVKGLTFQGGLIADVSVYQSLSSISNCHASGAVIGSYTVGGLIGNIDGKSTIKVTLSNSYATGNVSGDNHSIGGLVGSHGGYSEISGCYAEGTVTALARTDGYQVQNVGGLVGMNYGQISTSNAVGAVNGGFQVGGLVGTSESGSINRCYATGNVNTSSDRAGGLVGLNYAAINDSYATGSVTGNNRVGGLLGLFHTGTVSRCYAAGLVKGGSLQPNIGGLCGFADGTIAASYWDTGTTGQSTSSGGGSPLNTSQMKQQQNFSGWDFSSIWEIKADSYPTLR